jgi:methyl-accepting chemotaxis protein
MGRDVTSMADDMRAMMGQMGVMARSMVEGQAGMSQDFTRVRAGMEMMTKDMGRMAGDMHALNGNISTMTGAIDTMNKSMATMNQSMMMMNHAIGRMDANMAQMAYDINKFTRPESIMTPFR